MMSQSFRVTGELVNGQLVKLDVPIPLPAGKVRVIVEELVAQRPPNLAEFETTLRERQAARNHVPRTKEEVDAYLAAERASWDR